MLLVLTLDIRQVRTRELLSYSFRPNPIERQLVRPLALFAHELDIRSAVERDPCVEVRAAIELAVQ